MPRPRSSDDRDSDLDDDDDRPRRVRAKRRDEDDEDDDDRPRRKRRRDEPSPVNRAKSYAIGGGLVLVGLAMWGGAALLARTSHKTMSVLSGLGAAVILVGIGLFIHPLTNDQMTAFANDEDPGWGSVFRAAPVFWKVWLLVSLLGMAAGIIVAAR